MMEFVARLFCGVVSLIFMALAGAGGLTILGAQHNWDGFWHKAWSLLVVGTGIGLCCVATICFVWAMACAFDNRWKASE